jgi:Uma2 family endonuclease
LYAYPDLTIVCGEQRFHDEQRDVLLNPTVLIEVLSPSTEAFDRGRKFARYQQIASLPDYVLVAQDEPRIEHYVRQANDRWLLSVATGLAGSLTVASLDATLPLAEVYDGIVFPPLPPQHPDVDAAAPPTGSS